MFYSEDHLRIAKIRTADGMTPMLGADEKPIKKIVFAPLTKDSKRLLEDQNSRLPTALKMKIEVVKAYKPEPVIHTPAVDEEKEALKKQLADLQSKHDNLMNSKVANIASAKEPIPAPALDHMISGGTSGNENVPADNKKTSNEKK